MRLEYRWRPAESAKRGTQMKSVTVYADVVLEQEGSMRKADGPFSLWAAYPGGR